jgi:hypothetical protein
VVIPVVSKQTSRLKDMLRRWDTFEPCVDGDADMLRHIQSTSTPPVLSFILSVRDDEDSIAEKALWSEIIKTATASAQVSRCFSSIVVSVIRLSAAQDEHVTGARLQFEHFLKYGPEPGTQGRRGYALFIEPDVTPVRQRWLTTIAASVLWPAAPFFVQGSMYSGTQRLSVKYLPSRLHMNGNAVYRISHDNRHETIVNEREHTSGTVGAFADFYFNFVRPYIVAKNGDSKNAYDTDIIEFAIDPNNYDILRNTLAHNLVWSKHIVNMWRSAWTLAEITARFPDAVLVHGGSCYEPGLKVCA